MTEKSMERCSKSLKFIAELAEAFYSAISDIDDEDDVIGVGKGINDKTKIDFEEAVEILRENQLLENKGNRFHNGQYKQIV